MDGWKRYEKGLHYVGPHWIRFYGDGFTGTAFEEATIDGRYTWCVTDREQPAMKTFHQGIAVSVEEAKLAADAAVLDRKRGRSSSVVGEVATSTDRNRRRIDRLLASEHLARRLVEDLAKYHQELVVAGNAVAAERIALSLRRAALAALSDYMRRTASIRGRGIGVSSSLDMEAYEKAVLQIADEIEVLAEKAGATYGDVEALGHRLRQMGAFPDSELYSAAVQSFLFNVQPD
jgi:hypothetical protein